jgi:hypothetical protein
LITRRTKLAFLTGIAVASHVIKVFVHARTIRKPVDCFACIYGNDGLEICLETKVFISALKVVPIIAGCNNDGGALLRKVESSIKCCFEIVDLLLAYTSVRLFTENHVDNITSTEVRRKNTKTIVG